MRRSTPPGYSPLPSGRWARRSMCPCCGKRSVLLSWFTDWYGSDTTCLRCGDMFKGEERLPRPFSRNWREENKTKARAKWRRGPLPDTAANDPRSRTTR